MHVLAAAIYVEYKEALKQGSQSYSHWLVQAVENGQLRGEKLQGTINRFFSANPPP
jgi:hypothetical protein